MMGFLSAGTTHPDDQLLGRPIPMMDQFDAIALPAIRDELATEPTSLDVSRGGSQIHT
jgi:hypothetical protein